MIGGAFATRVGDALAARTPRERVLLAAGGVAVLVWLALTQVWQPLMAERRALAAQIARHDRALAALAAAPAAVARPPADPRPVHVILTDSAADYRIAIRRLEPDGDRATLTLDEADFATILLWLDVLEADHGLRASAVDLQRRPTPGVVTARLTLEREDP